MEADGRPRQRVARLRPFPRLFRLQNSLDLKTRAKNGHEKYIIRAETHSNAFALPGSTNSCASWGHYGHTTGIICARVRSGLFFFSLERKASLSRWRPVFVWLSPLFFNPGGLHDMTWRPRSQQRASVFSESSPKVTKLTVTYG